MFDLLFGDPRIRTWAERLGTITSLFRMDFIGLEREEAMKRVKDSWSGCQVSEVSDEIFAVRNQGILDPFVFYFDTLKEKGDKIQIIRVEANPPFINVILAIDERATNYLLRCPQESLGKEEKKLCKALKKHGKIPQGRRSG